MLCWFFLDQITKTATLEQSPNIFLSQLMLLFQICPNCKDILVETNQQGTMIVVNTHCGNLSCTRKEHVWQSQPKIEGTNLGAGSAILLAVASASKVLRVFSHMGLACHSLRTFFRHQKVKTNGYTFFCNTHSKLVFTALIFSTSIVNKSVAKQAKLLIPFIDIYI